MQRIGYFILTLSLVIPVFILSSCEEEDQHPDPAQVDFVVQDASAYNANDGSIDLVINGGEPPFYFFWNTGDTTQSVSGLHAGDYWVRMIYGRNGSSFFESSVKVSQPEPVPLDLDFQVTHVPLYGKPLGAVSVNASGGTPPYSYKWSTGATTPSVEGLFAGQYSVVVSDSGDPFMTETEGEVVINQPEFVCGQDSIMDIDGHLYPTVVIGDQCWMAENLRTQHRPDSPYPDLVPIEGRFCQGLFCEQEEGAHYTWYAAMNGAEAATSPDQHIQGVCPEGWHIPTRDEYAELEQWLAVPGNGGEGTFAGAKMKGAESSSGFNALFTGNWGYGVYVRAAQASFWTSSEPSTNPNNAHLIYVTEDTPFVNATNRSKLFGLNVRCVKD